MTGHVLVVAKAPVAGQVKTRLAGNVGAVAAADLAAASLLDTIDAVESVTEPHRRLVAMTGELADAERCDEIRERLRSWSMVFQRGQTFAERLVNAHADAATLWGRDAVVCQVGVDTPQVNGHDLLTLVAAASDPPVGVVIAALGPAADGGWWGLATTAAGYVDRLVDVPMSRDDTCVMTAVALRMAGARVEMLHELLDVDTIDDACRVASAFATTRFAQRFRELGLHGLGRAGRSRRNRRVRGCCGGRNTMTQ
ncbi:MAG: DUF2064 domain-containing protein [Sporichthyaceae bacterium]